ncbi:MAG: Gfo/Idh/MocA family protein [Armatimonadota bacterium]
MQVRVGMIATGGMARHHVGQLLRIPDAVITALCDTDPEQLARTQRQFPELADTWTTPDYKALLARDDVDAVIIVTPHTQHFEQVNDAMDAGKHILCEKPMVCNVEHAHALLERLRTYPKVFGIAYQRHAMGQFKLIRDTIASGKFGEVTFLSALQCQGWKKAVANTWRQTMELSGGGQLNDSGSHLVDILLHITGLTVAEVSAFIDHRGTPVDIDSALAIRFTNGAQGNISVVGDSVVGWHEDISIWCEKGAFLYRNGQLTIVDEHGNRTTMDGSHLPPTQNIDENFIGAINGTNDPAAPALCGLRTIELTEAAWRSGAQGGVPVKMN